MSVLLSVNYILRYVFPGDYGCYTEEEEFLKYCCDNDHVVGRPFYQWNDSTMMREKRSANEINGLKTSISDVGITNAIYIVLGPHRILSNGHHRFYAAWDLGLKHVPVEFSDDSYQHSIGAKYLRNDTSKRRKANL